MGDERPTLGKRSFSTEDGFFYKQFSRKIPIIEPKV
jgi:hypothetical protein